MLPKPSIQLFEPHSAGLVEVHQERKRIKIVELQPVAVDSQERCRHGHRNPLVSIDERVVLREALPESSRFLNQVAVVPAAGSSQGRLQSAVIPDTVRATEARNQSCANATVSATVGYRVTGEALQEIRMLGDELIRSLQERRFRAEGHVPAFQVIDEPKHGILLLRRERLDNVG